jgi:Na+:H+ antiporter, NhaA family
MIERLTKPLAKPRSALREFLNSEASGGYLLMAAAAIALVLANAPSREAYEHALHVKLGALSVQHWINDGLMAVFFLLVGLEIKREFVDGHLASWADRRLPAIAALAGMAAPALVFLAFVLPDGHLARGWAVPAATDIAFAIAVLALLGKRAPASLKLLLTTVAIVDDMGAVAIIALAYTPAIKGVFLLAALLVFGAMWVANRAGLTHWGWYAAGFALLWFAVLHSGVHATIAGVLAASAVPVRLTKGTPDAEDSTLHKMEHALHKPVAWLIVPLFGLANAGVPLSVEGLNHPLVIAVTLGLFLGKQLGVFAAIWGAVKLGLAAKPAKANWAQIYGMALLCGIGFTMSLFIGTLAFEDPAEVDAMRTGVLAGSVLSALAGFSVLRFAANRKPALKP